MILKKYIRLIIENTEHGTGSIHPKILGMINKVKLENTKRDDDDKIFFEYVANGSYHEIKANRLEPADIPDDVMNSLEFKKSRNRIIDKDGEERDVYVVIQSECGENIGPLLYEIAIEKVSSLMGVLVSDRSQVSDEAQRVWDVYYARCQNDNNLNCVLTDLDKNSLKMLQKPNFYNRSDHPNLKSDYIDQIKNSTPEYAWDDMIQTSAIKKMIQNGTGIPEDWSQVEESTCFAYYKNSMPVIDMLKSKLLYID